MLNSASRNRSPFTQTQWQELEHQALIYKYLVTGTPVPCELVFSVKRSLESSLASRIFPPQSMGWGCFQVGYGRKTDPEPGRCRRTDGKKWRCSKEAYPDSKYCEKHMHRGRNRSRKPVEQVNTSTQTQTSSMSMSGLSPLSSVSINRNQNHNQLSSSSTSPSSANSPYSFSPLSSPVESDHLFQNSASRTTSPYLYSGSSAPVDKDYRYFNGMREGSDERSFFPESSRLTMQDPFHNITMNTNSYKSFNRSQFETLASEVSSKQLQDNDQQQQHCFVLGTDFKSSTEETATTTRPIKLEKEEETQKSLHHFFGEWPPKNSSESWLDLSSSTSRLQSDG